jgi:hypothetical protein
MEDEDTRTPFLLLADKSLGGEGIKFMEWCPTMDLLAVVTLENHVWIHRAAFGSSMQRLVSITPPAKTTTGVVTAIAWRDPDGL